MSKNVHSQRSGFTPLWYILQQEEPALIGVSWGMNLEMGKQDRPEITCSWEAVTSAAIPGIVLKGKQKPTH